jgi:hypothetical protein
MIEIGLSGEGSELAKKWPSGYEIKHWPLIRSIDKLFKGEKEQGPSIDLINYEDVRGILDNFVHGNFIGVRHYPGQARGDSALDDSFISNIHTLDGLIQIFIVSSLLIVPLINNKYNEIAKGYLDLFGYDTEGLAAPR